MVNKCLCPSCSIEAPLLTTEGGVCSLHGSMKTGLRDAEGVQTGRLVYWLFPAAAAVAGKNKK